MLDVDLTGPSIPRLLGIENAKVKQAPGGWLPVEVHSSQILPPVPIPEATPSNIPSSSNGDSKPECPVEAARARANGASSKNEAPVPIGPLHAMSLAFLLTSRSSAIVWRGPKKTAMIRQFLSDVLWPSVDYLLIDTPPGTSDEHISLVETLLKTVSENASDRPRPNLAGAVIVTTPQAVAISDVRKEINFCAKTGVKVIGVVENMSGYVCPCCGVATHIFSKGGGKVMAAEFGVPFLGSVPIDGVWAQLIEQGVRPVYGRVASPDNKDDVADDDDDEDVNDEGIPNWSPPGADLPSTNLAEAEPVREEGLLVDKYRSCQLYPTFEDIASKAVETIRSDSAVTIPPTTMGS